MRRGVGLAEEVSTPDKHGCTVLHNVVENNLNAAVLVPLLAAQGVPLDAVDADRELIQVSHRR